MSKKPDASLALADVAALPPALPDQIADCNWLHDQATASANRAHTLAQNAAHLAVVLGLRLTQIKLTLPHGEFGKLFAINETSEAKSEPRFRFEFSDRTARKYMLAAEGALKRPGLPAKQRKLLEGLAGAESLRPEDAAAEASPEGVALLSDDAVAALDAATRGQTLRQLYLDLGIVKGDATETRRGGDGETERRGDGETGRPGKSKIKPLTPEETWELLYRGGLGEVEKFFLAGDHRKLAQERVEELRETLAGWLEDLKKLRF